MTFKKVLASIMSAGIMMALFVTSASAARCRIEGNGPNSTNRCRVNRTTTNTLTQKNEIVIVNEVDIDQDSGDNEVEDNTSGRNSDGIFRIRTGRNESSVNISNHNVGGNFFGGW